MFLFKKKYFVLLYTALMMSTDLECGCCKPKDHNPAAAPRVSQQDDQDGSADTWSKRLLSALKGGLKQKFNIDLADEDIDLKPEDVQDAGGVLNSEKIKKVCVEKIICPQLIKALEQKNGVEETKKILDACKVKYTKLVALQEAKTNTKQVEQLRSKLVCKTIHDAEKAEDAKKYIMNNVNNVNEAKNKFIETEKDFDKAANKFTEAKEDRDEAMIKYFDLTIKFIDEESKFLNTYFELINTLILFDNLSYEKWKNDNNKIYEKAKKNFVKIKELLKEKYKLDEEIDELEKEINELEKEINELEKETNELEKEIDESFKEAIDEKLEALHKAKETCEEMGKANTKEKTKDAWKELADALEQEITAWKQVKELADALEQVKEIEPVVDALVKTAQALCTLYQPCEEAVEQIKEDLRKELKESEEIKNFVADIIRSVNADAS